MRSRGFSYVELVVTVAIVMVLAAAAMPMIEISTKRSRELELRSSLRDIRKALDAYKAAVDEGRIARRTNDSGYPPSLDILVDGVQDARSVEAKRIHFMRRLPRDPFAADPTMRASETWGTRSYARPHEAPGEGVDVFDVYSRSPQVGLNSVAYREW